MLPNNMRRVLDVHAEYNKATPDALIEAMVGAGESFKHSLTFKAATGKASNKDTSKEGSEGLKLDAATALITGKGYRTEIELNPGSNYSVKTLGRFTEFQKKSGENMGAGTTM